MLTTAAITTAGVALIAVSLRLITRISPFSVKWGADDWVVTGIAPVAACQLMFILAMVYYGFGQDIYMLSPAAISNAAKFWYFSELAFVILTFSTKIAILCFYLRLFPTGEIRNVTYLLISVCVTAMVSIFFAHLFQCWPISYRWRMYLGDDAMYSETPPTCRVDRQGLNFAFSILNLVIEVVIVSLPIPKLLKLQLQWWKKIEVVSVFAFGFIEQNYYHRHHATLDHAYSELFFELHM
ncbi:uncharacterized protein EKO05_0010833 [Ascochyta rabiei]|uniref:uncharacterized protein n=1 Tax=Didymella rabiei TaxID=5454 RepID=UPI0021F92A71|nr:uncharacterized protein EKO05_0010833 [Ascochyta rabiei]UPX20605.1 hypothetical protein EKO05_0010833 [Ascochyta rabiei]